LGYRGNGAATSRLSFMPDDKQVRAFRRIAPMFEIYREMMHSDLTDESEQTDLADFCGDLIHYTQFRGLNIVAALESGRRYFAEES
jgi:hypothetical protein